MHAKTRNKDNAAIVDTFSISLLVVLHWNLCCCCCCCCCLLRFSIFAGCAFIIVMTVIFDLLLFTLLPSVTALNSLNLPQLLLLLRHSHKTNHFIITSSSERDSMEDDKTLFSTELADGIQIRFHYKTLIPSFTPSLIFLTPPPRARLGWLCGGT